MGDIKPLPVEEFQFKEYKLEAVQDVLQTNLQQYFAEVSVTVTDCPDLSLPPFSLATKGFGGGSTGIVDLGGPPYLIPVADRTKVYDLARIVPSLTGLKDYSQGWYISGAGAGPWPSQGSNCEMVINMRLGKDGHVERNRSKVALTWADDQSTKNVVVKNLDQEETRCALLANFMVSSGTPGKILEIKCSRRIDPTTNFTGSLRNSLAKEFGTEPVGLAGLFMVHNANSKIHIMQDFSANPLLSEEDLNNWLQFFDMDPPMLFQSVLVSADPGLDLRVEHSHGWSLNGKSEGGHYHYDLMPETVEYHGYYAMAQKLWRVDRPTSTHLIGRD